MHILYEVVRGDCFDAPPEKKNDESPPDLPATTAPTPKGEPPADVPSWFVCPISLALMKDPVMLSDGHTLRPCGSDLPRRASRK